VEPDRAAIRRQLLAWYRARKRDLPFRRTKDPYAILVAETILQRTRMQAGLPYYERFLAAFPTVHDLAVASEAEVLRVWEGLGYYRRARNLHAAAKVIVERHRGELPSDFEALRALPGIGDYTAGALGSIAFGLRVPAVDGNVTRVLSRLYRIEEDTGRSETKRHVRALAAELVPTEAPGEWNQAVMELGATVCLPRSPRCGSCPVSSECLARAAGVQGEIPKATAKRSVPLVRVVFAVATRRDSVLLVRRTAGLHAGLYGLPGGELEPKESERSALRRHLARLGVKAVVTEPLGPVRHAFSHLRWEGASFRCSVRGTPRGAEWVAQDRLAILPLVPFQRRLLDQAMDRATNAQRRTTDAVFGTKTEVAWGKADYPRSSHPSHRG